VITHQKVVNSGHERSTANRAGDGQRFRPGIARRRLRTATRPQSVRPPRRSAGITRLMMRSTRRSRPRSAPDRSSATRQISGQCCSSQRCGICDRAPEAASDALVAHPRPRRERAGAQDRSHRLSLESIRGCPELRSGAERGYCWLPGGGLLCPSCGCV
jgi:hypothetical protein